MKNRQYHQSDHANKHAQERDNQCYEKDQEADVYFDKENIPLKVNYHDKKDKKFAYIRTEDKPASNPRQKSVQRQQKISPEFQIQRLNNELKKQKEKVKYLQAKTIEQQYAVLDQLAMLEQKFQQLSTEKHRLEVQLHRTKNTEQNKKNSYQNIQSQNWKQKYEQLNAEHKKIKHISDSMVDMMYKVDKIEGNVKQAWRWTKKIIWQYQGIRKKAFQWKEVYDEVNAAIKIEEYSNFPSN